VDQERTGAAGGALRPDPGDRVIGKITVEDVVGRVGWLDGALVLDQRGVELIGETAQEALEVVETQTARHWSNGPFCYVGTLWFLPNHAVS
jgi:hypothetical protein